MRQEAENSLRQARADHEAHVATAVQRAVTRVETSYKQSISALQDQLEQCQRRLRTAEDNPPGRAETEQLRQVRHGGFGRKAGG